MNSKIIAIATILCTCLTAFPRTEYERVLMQIEENNPTLKMLRKATDASILENHTGLNLNDPEIVFIYQWGNRTPDKKLIDITQTFDLSVLSGARKREAEARDMISEADYHISRRDLLNEAEQAMINLVYHHRVDMLYQGIIDRLENLISQTPDDRPDIRLAIMNIKSDIKLNHLEIKKTEAVLSRLNGGISPEWKHPSYREDFYSSDTLEDYSSPELLLLEAEVKVASRGVKVSKAEGLPQFTLGYSSEYIKGDNHYGLIFAMQLPLWSNKGKIKAAKAAEAVAQARLEDAQIAYRQEVKNLIQQCEGLKSLIADYTDLYAETERTTENTDPIERIQTLLEMEKRILVTQRDYQIALSDLRKLVGNIL